MLKRSVLRSLVLVLAAGFILGLPISFCFAQTQEELTITTYYPAPYGVYNELQAKKMAIGDTNEDGQMSSADQPPDDGQLYVAKSAIYKPQAGDPATWAGEQGELVYSSMYDSFYYYNGTFWVKQAGAGGVSVLYFACPWGSDFNIGAGQGWGNQCGVDGLACCTPTNCPDGWTSVATYAESLSIACGDSNCLWDGNQLRHPAVAGHTVRVCVKD